MSGYTPEEIFLKNNPVISPVDMSNCLISRTAAMIDSVIESLHRKDNQSSFCPDRTSLILDQVACNLTELEKSLTFGSKQKSSRRGRRVTIFFLFT